MSIEKEANKNISRDMLESYRRVLYQVKDYFDSVDLNNHQLDIDTKMKLTKSILDAGGLLGKNFETLSILENKVEKEQVEEVKRRGGSKTSKFEQ